MVHVAPGITDMRKGLDGLAMLVQRRLQQNPLPRQSGTYPIRWRFGKCARLRRTFPLRALKASQMPNQEI